MDKKITADQYRELMDTYESRDTKQIVKAFDEIANLKVKPYTAYQFFDAGDSYIGDDNYNTIYEILRDTGIEVETEVRYD